MIVSLDTETRGLDASAFVMGCVVDHNYQAAIFHEKDLMWKHIINLGVQQAKKGKVLYVYAHNHHYDFCAYGNRMEPGLKIFSTDPFIVSYTAKVWKKGKLAEGEFVEKECIKFLDTYQLFGMSLKDLGAMIGIPKMETPKEFIEGKIDGMDEAKAIQYMVNDAVIVRKSIDYLHDKLLASGVKLRRLYTISQIAMGYMLNKLKRMDDTEHFFYKDADRMIVKRTKYPKRVHEAYRGGKVHCYKLGQFEHVTAIDCNSLYPYAAINIRFPDLRTERLLYMNKDVFVEQGYIDMIGISNVMMRNVSDDYGLLSVRTDSFNYSPLKGKYMIGTWTNMEIKMAMQSGYELLDVNWTMVYEEGKNLLKPVMEELYRMRTESTNPFDYYFYKQIMNFAIGKFAQHKLQVEYRYDDVEKADEYVARNFQIIRTEGMEYLYKKEGDKRQRYKNYYCPILPVLINAYARCYMHQQMKKIPIENLLYTDTDSIYFIGDYLDRFEMGKGIGQFKLQHMDEAMFIYGNKGYSIGTEIRVSGISRIDMNMEDFRKGYMKQRRMVGILDGTNSKKSGTFTESQRNLLKQMEDTMKVQLLMQKQKIYIDALPNISREHTSFNALELNHYRDKIREIADNIG